MTVALIFAGWLVGGFLLALLLGRFFAINPRDDAPGTPCIEQRQHPAGTAVDISIHAEGIARG